MKPHVFVTFSRTVAILIITLLVAVLFTISALAEKPLPAWYREGATLGDTLVDSKIELSRLTREKWAALGFVQTPGKTFPSFLGLPRYWASSEVPKDAKVRTYEFPTGGCRDIFVGGTENFVGRLFARNVKYWAVDARGERTHLNHLEFSDGIVSKREVMVRDLPRATEYQFRLPEGTRTFVVEGVFVTDMWQMGWVDIQSRIELVTESYAPFVKFGKLIDAATRRDREKSGMRKREAQHAKVCDGLWEGYADMARRYYWELPKGRQEKIDALVPDRSKIDRRLFLTIRDAFIRYYAVVEPKVREYGDMRLGGQVRDFKTLIEQTDGIPGSKRLLPQLDELTATAKEIETGIRESRLEDFSEADAVVTRLARIKKTFALECKLKLARLTLAYVQSSKPLPEDSARLERLADRIAKADSEGFEELLGEVKALRRRILFQHPDLQFKKLLVCKNPRPGPGHMCDQYLGRHTRKGKGLFVVENWLTDTPVETNITAQLPEGYYHHPDLSFDGKRVAFAFCDTTAKGHEKRHWIYEAQVDGSGVRQLTGTLKDPMERVGNRKTVVIEDWDPCYLPDGGFAFVSTRSQSYGRCHGGRYVPAFLLYRMNGDGGDIKRLSLGEANEWDPAVLPDGRIVYTRWDYINRHDTRFQSLWTTHPDGTGTAHYYGNYSTSPCMIADTQPIPGTHKVVSTAMAHHGYTHGSIIIVDVSKGEDGFEPLTVLTPEIAFPEASYDAMTWMLKAPIPVFDSRSKGGLKSGATAMAPYPINDTLFLCSYAPDGRTYNTYLIDTMGGRELIYGGDEVSAAMPVQPRDTPRAIPSVLPKNPGENMGTLVVQDVYINRHVDDKHPVEKGSIKSLRVNLILTQPTRVHWQRGAVANEVIKRPLGTVPVDPDGSVALAAPSGVPLQLQALDADGMAVMTMRSFVYLHPGETQNCIGCHENRTSTPPDDYKKPVKVHNLRPVPGVDYDDMAFSFARTVQPVLDRYCIGCHGLGGTAGYGKRPRGSYVFSVRCDESQGINQFNTFPASYRSLVGAARARLAHRNGETVTSVPRDYFSPTSKLSRMLLDGHHGVALDDDSFERIITWLDLNSQCYGTYLPNREEQRRPDTTVEAELRAYVKQLFGDEPAAQPLGALVNPANLEESRILRGPLQASGGGWGTIGSGYESTEDPRYLRMRELASKVYQPLPYNDINGTCGRPKCICGNCWIRKMVDEGVYRKQLESKLAADETPDPG